MPEDRPGSGPFDRPGFGPFDDLFERLIGDLGSTLGGGHATAAAGRRSRTGGRTTQLDRFGRDLTEEARHGRLDPVIGREAEIEQVLEVLARRTKNNPVLVGDPGVGKTAIAEGIAQRVADGEVPEALRGVRVVALDLAGMVAGTRYRGDFEQRLTGVIDEVIAAERQVVLFVDELHAVVGAGSAEGAPMDAASMLKPALARGELRLIGATTAGEYRRHIEKDAALERRFEPVRIAEPTVAATIAILRGLRPRYETHHDVRIDDAALVAAAELADRYLTDRFLPDKAIDLVDRASARARIRAGRSPTPRRPSEQDAAAELVERLEQLRRARDVAVDAEEFERALLLTRELEAAEAELAAAGGHGHPGRRRGADHRRRHRRGGRAGHRHPGGPADRDRAEPAAGAGGAAAPPGGRAGRRGRGGGRRGAGRPGRAGPPGPAGRLVPVPRPDRGGQDRAGPGAGRGAVRHARRAAALRHERVRRPQQRAAAGRGAARARRLRRRRAAHRGGPAHPVRGAAAGRDREGAPRRHRHPAAGARRRAAHRRARPHGRLHATPS